MSLDAALGPGLDNLENRVIFLPENRVIPELFQNDQNVRFRPARLGVENSIILE